MSGDFVVDNDGTIQLSVEYDNRMVLIINWTHRCTDIFMVDFGSDGGGVPWSRAVVGR